MTLAHAASSDDMSWAHLLAGDILPDEMLAPRNLEEIAALPGFLTTLRAAEHRGGRLFGQLPPAFQNALIERRLSQLVNICRTNPLWRARIDGAVGSGPVTSFEAFQAIPPTDKETARQFFTGERPGMILPLSQGGFQVATSGGTASGKPTEIVYPLDELQDTYRWAGEFLGRHIVERHMPADAARWVACTLADHMMWSSSSMVGGVLQSIPGINYIGAGAIDAPVCRRILAYSGTKAIMGISASIADLVGFAKEATEQERASLRVALYGSGGLEPKVHADLRAAYPNLTVLSFFAAMQAETIGLQLDGASPDLTAIPGLHLIEIVDEHDRWVDVGEEGDLLVTRLFGHGAPVLRYRLGDRMVRRPDLVSGDLNAMRFAYAGRSSDRFLVGGYPLFAPAVRDAVVQALAEEGIVSLDHVAQHIQIRLDHRARSLRIVATTEQAGFLSRGIDASRARGAILSGVAQAGASPLRSALRVWRKLEGSGYSFDLVLVPPGAPDLHTTEVGKTPLLVELR